ncbi:unnamed protein product [Acanthoscelides obtectus]|uniref:Uncharacterized protein n=1 Tax=Acanthoscelides obtectus TaxID=200917 RepID=A0A9P0KAC7_ACAOB|nr:unnamed protein product [Acanthoscelides obtectus]CAK1652336.1 hypothetical protein AOBTE_LOCUS17792 [Acanthoscelides obtectus]
MHLRLFLCTIKGNKLFDSTTYFFKKTYNMENILNKDTDNPHLISEIKTEDDVDMDCEELHEGSITEYQSPSSKELSTEIEGNIVKHEYSEDMIKQEPLPQKHEDMLDLGTDIILPQTAQNASSQPPKQKKESKSKKELEEEEREKMHIDTNSTIRPFLNI